MCVSWPSGQTDHDHGSSIRTGIGLPRAAQTSLQRAVLGVVIPQSTLCGVRKNAVVWLAHLSLPKSL